MNDKFYIAGSLEGRVPMLDIELVKFVECSPLHYRVALQKTKLCIKKMVKPLVFRVIILTVWVE